MAISGFRFAAAVLFLSVLAVVLSPVSSRAKTKHDVIGKFISITDKAEVGTLGSAVTEAAVKGDDVRVGDNIKTRKGGAALLEFRDGTRIAVFENTTVRISDFIMDVSVNERKVKVTLFKGKVSVFVMGLHKADRENKKVAWNNSLVRVETKTAVANTKKALFAVEIDADDATILSVGSGEVAFKNVKRNVRGEMPVTENQVSKVTKYDPPTVPKDVAEDRMEEIMGGFFVGFIDDSEVEDVVVGGKKEAFNPPVVEKKEEKGSWQKPVDGGGVALPAATETEPGVDSITIGEPGPAAEDAPADEAATTDEAAPESGAADGAEKAPAEDATSDEQ